MSQGKNQKYTNRLEHETSPYLLQHAQNPVDWYPWGEEALKRAQDEDRPILLSIGYSACHWCHVMAHESFEDEEIAGLMNKNFICIKVDREERPDLDDIYMAATIAINNGQGGWPMTLFLMPDQQPFFAGTYFPPVDRYGRPGFSTVLLRISELWQKDRSSLDQQGKSLTEHLRKQTTSGLEMSVGEDEIKKAVIQLEAEFDSIRGGFGSAPKFPPATALSLLLKYYSQTQDARSLNMVKVTLDAMARGGMYDQVGGGFHRYSTDDQWLVPHFEKMLYDNALLAKIYLEAYQVTKEPFYREIASETLDYILREMTSPEGGFYSATDADSEGREGKFFVWSPDKVQQILDAEDARLFCAYYDITEGGNWEGTSIPNIPRPLTEIAQSLSLDPKGLAGKLDHLRQTMYEARLKRVPPGLDDKILTAWNGLMIGAMAEGARVLGEPRYLAAAGQAADFIKKRLMSSEGRLLRTYRSGKAHLNAYLEDYAYLAEGLIDLYEAGASKDYLQEAARLANRIIEDFASTDGLGLFNTSHDHETLLVRHREGYDGAIPNPNATASHMMARLSFHFDQSDFRKFSIQGLRAYGKAINRFPRAFCKSLQAADFLLGGATEIALVGQSGEKGFEALRREINSHHIPNRIIATVSPEETNVIEESPQPFLEGKGLVHGKPAVYICRNFVCQEPITQPGQVVSALSQHQGFIKSSRQTSI